MVPYTSYIQALQSLDYYEQLVRITEDENIKISEDNAIRLVN